MRIEYLMNHMKKSLQTTFFISNNAGMILQGKKYGAEFLKKQDYKKVDAITGATWTHTEFEIIIRIALKQTRL